MGEWQRQEADLFARYDARFVALELDVDELKRTRDKYVPIVDKLRDNDLVADAIAARLAQTATMKLTKVHVAIGLVALFLPPMVGSALTYLLLKGGH